MRTVFRVAHTTVGDRPKEIQSGERWPLVLMLDTEYRALISGERQNRTAVLVEGAADALRLASGIQCSADSKLRDNIAIVCLWGKTVSEENVFRLSKTFPHFYVLLDRERGLDRQGEQVASMKLMGHFGAICEGHCTRHRWSRVEGGASDPAELTQPQTEYLLHSALERTGG
jgi:hypothetical protein